MQKGKRLVCELCRKETNVGCDEMHSQVSKSKAGPRGYFRQNQHSKSHAGIGCIFRHVAGRDFECRQWHAI